MKTYSGGKTSEKMSSSAGLGPAGAGPGLKIP